MYKTVKIESPPTREIVEKFNLRAIAKLVLEKAPEDRPEFLTIQLELIAAFEDIHQNLIVLVREQLRREATTELKNAEKFEKLVKPAEFRMKVEICKIVDFDPYAERGQRVAGYYPRQTLTNRTPSVHRSSIR